jgi:hypothetical protein
MLPKIAAAKGNATRKIFTGGNIVVLLFPMVKCGGYMPNFWACRFGSSAANVLNPCTIPNFSPLRPSSRFGRLRDRVLSFWASERLQIAAICGF